MTRLYRCTARSLWLNAAAIAPGARALLHPRHHTRRAAQGVGVATDSATGHELTRRKLHAGRKHTRSAPSLKQALRVSARLALPTSRSLLSVARGLPCCAKGGLTPVG